MNKVTEVYHKIQTKKNLIIILSPALILLIAPVHGTETTSTTNLLCQADLSFTQNSCNTGLVAKNTQILISLTGEVFTRPGLSVTFTLNSTLKIYRDVNHKLVFTSTEKIIETLSCPPDSGACTIGADFQWTPTHTGNHTAIIGLTVIVNSVPFFVDIATASIMVRPH